MICPCYGKDISRWRDVKILKFCKNGKSMSQISRYLEIAIPNVSARVNRLKQENKVIINRLGRGKPSIVQSTTTKLNEDNTKQSTK